MNLKRKYEKAPDNDSEGNCHTCTKEMIEKAGGKIPPAFNPPGLNPDLKAKSDNK